MALGGVSYVLVAPAPFQDQQRFPLLFEKIQEILSSVLSTHLAPTKSFVSDLINIQLAYINNLHPEFGDAKLLSSFSRHSTSDASSFTADSAPMQVQSCLPSFSMLHLCRSNLF